MQFYPGCHYCDTPAGVIVQRWTKQSAKEWHVDTLPELPWRLCGYPDTDPTADCAIPVMDAGTLKRELVKFAKGCEGEYDCEGFAEDGIDEVFHPTACAGFDEWRSSIAKECKGVK